MSTKQEVLKWLHDNLSGILSFPVPTDLTEYLLTIENDRDIDEFLKTLLDFSEPSHRNFVANFKQIRHGAREASSVDDVLMFKGNDKKKKTRSDVGKNDLTLPSVVLEDDRQVKKDSSKKKTKYVNLYSPEGAGKDVVLLKGRHHCDCQASKHRLINNCLKCGRIICAQEGSGPCIFCGTLVCSKEEQDFINTKTVQSQKLLQNLMDSGKPEGWEKALEQRDRLLEYDKTSQRRTKVIDDEGEYFSSSSVWLSDNERKRMAAKEEQAQSRRHVSRLERKVTLDFAGRQVKDDELEDFGEEFYADVLDKTLAQEFAGIHVHPDVQPLQQPMFVGSKHTKPRTSTNEPGNVTKVRVQDREFLEMTDAGVCLSMHQPWASLLVAGIMRHEGRSWYSSHRGRLWIAAASKVPTDEEIKTYENFFRQINSGKSIVFPGSYPTSCLLGCVTVVDCLPQEEYRRRYPDGESESPFVFVCEDPRELRLRFPVTGRHKIYKLDSKIHQAAVKALHRILNEENHGL